MKAFGKILIPIVVLALLVCAFVFAVSAEDTTLPEGTIATSTLNGAVTYYSDVASLEAALDSAASGTEFDIYKDVTLSTGSWGINNQYGSILVVRIHGVTVTHTGTATLNHKQNWNNQTLTIEGQPWRISTR